MASTFHRALILISIALAIVAACLLLCAAPVRTASAEVWYVGEDEISFDLDYGALPGDHYFRAEGDIWFKVTSYIAKRQNGSTFDLLTAGHVSATPGTYHIDATTNTTLCDSTGKEIEGDHTFDGTIEVVVKANDLPIKVTSSLEKAYGDAATALTWDFLDEKDRDGTIEITFTSLGFAESAPRGDYDIEVVSVLKGGDDVTALYDVVVYTPELQLARYTVTPRPISFTMDEEQTVAFNDYLLSDGESVLSLPADEAGANGETLTAYYRLKSAPAGALTVGSHYEVEAYRYTVTSPSGTISYSPTDSSNYAPSFLGTEDSVVAGKGILTIYQGDAALHEGALDYLCQPLNYLYLDPVVSDLYGVAIIPLSYYGSEMTLYANIDATGDLSAGEYTLTYVDYECDALTGVSFEGTITLTVAKRVLVYDGKDDAETASGDAFAKRISLTYGDKQYAFDLTADLSGRAVGEKVSYTSYSAVTDGNFELDLSAAEVTIVKRTTGVTLRSLGVTSIYYGSESALASLWVDYGTPSARQLSEIPITYAYSVAGQSARSNGLPRNPGSYVVYCSVASDASALYSYEGEEEIALTVEKRPVAVHYRITTASKVYGETFDIGSKSQLFAVYDYDEERGREDLEHPIADWNGAFGGKGLSSIGAAAVQPAGQYDFDVSGVSSNFYRIAAVTVYDISANNAVTEKFVVRKASSPEAPEITVPDPKGRTITVTVGKTTGLLKGEIATKSDYSDAKSTTSGNGSLSFTQLIYGQLYYIRVRIEDTTNYETVGAWRETTKAIPFLAPEVEVESVSSTGVVVTVAEMRNSVADYTVQYKVEGGSWQDGTEVVGLKANKEYTISFRVKNDGATGAAASIDVRTLRAPVEKENIELDLDRNAGTLLVSSTVEMLEYRLLSASGEPLSEEWADLGSFTELEKDTTYRLQVRVAANGDEPASDITEITIDTHKVKEPFSLKAFLSDQFLIVVGGGLLLVLIFVIVGFARARARANKEELGG